MAFKRLQRCARRVPEPPVSSDDSDMDGLPSAEKATEFISPELALERLQ